MSVQSENVTVKDDPLFVDLSSNEHATEIESLCMRCHEMGQTKMLCTKIPFFGDIIIMAFECECGFRNSEIMDGGSIADLGVEVTLKVNSPNDLNRQIVKGKNAVLRIPELDFEIPSGTGKLSTVEGFLEEAIFGLQHDQPVRRIRFPEDAAKIDEFIEKLLKLKNGETHFTIIVDDPSGNSFLENPLAPEPDPNLTLREYKRTKEQAEKMGYQADNAIDLETNAEKENTEVNNGDIEDDEVIVMPSTCNNCFKDVDVNIKKVDIPYFKEVIIMAMHCEKCGERSNEVKSGGAIGEKGTRLILKCESIEDLNRDVLKSSFATISIPEIKLESAEGVGGDKFTTIEGLLDIMKTQFLKENPFVQGDSILPGTRQKMTDFLCSLEQIIEGKQEFTFILDDPTSNSYIQNLYAPDPDPQLQSEEYERTKEQNDDIGLSDMITEGYQQNQ